MTTNQPNKPGHLKFTCPRCGCHEIKEHRSSMSSMMVIGIMVDDNGVDCPDEGEVSTNHGHIDRYACSGCDLTVCDDNSLSAVEGLDYHSLAASIREINEYNNCTSGQGQQCAVDGCGLSVGRDSGFCRNHKP